MTIPALHCDESKLRALWATDATCTEIGKAIGASRTWVSARAKKLGLPRRSVSTGALPAAKIAHAYVELGMTAEEIRDQLRAQFPTLAATTVRRVLEQRGIAIRKGIRRGHDAYLAECVRLYRSGMFHREIAAKLGLTVSQVGHRCRRILGSGKHGGPRPRIDIEKAMKMRAQGFTTKQVAEQFGVTRQAIHYHERRRSVSA